ncbi:MAG: hypothetical protein QG622_1455 [Actinomycetota bacterium]|nr:hypothetical protein [Actinomycetota bacterium]
MPKAAVAVRVCKEGKENPVSWTARQPTGGRSRWTKSFIALPIAMPPPEAASIRTRGTKVPRRQASHPPTRRLRTRSTGGSTRVVRYSTGVTRDGGRWATTHPDNRGSNPDTPFRSTTSSAIFAKTAPAPMIVMIAVTTVSTSTSRIRVVEMRSRRIHRARTLIAMTFRSSVPGSGTFGEDDSEVSDIEVGAAR